ncbi:MAG: molybdopterin-dependent oxidoreductase [Armatimonadota bacterium]
MSTQNGQERPKTAAESADVSKVVADTQAAQDAGVPMVSLVVDGKPVSVPKGSLVIEAAFSAGSDIPYFCYHPRLTSVGACRMCLASVELEMFGQRRASIMATCTIPAADGMVVKTTTPDVKKAQNGVLELILANHPLDCPVCDRGGECPLQNMTISYGPPNTRFIEDKRRYVKALPISENVVLDRERCITCMRCTRFASEIAGDSKLGLINRGAQSEVGPFLGGTFDSNFSGNTIEICPVGALTSRQFRFKGRPWEVKSSDSICTNCSNGCNIAVGHRMGEVVRINGRVNEQINEEWTCDKGKFGNADVNSPDRLTVPLIRDAHGILVETDWDTALAAVVTNMRYVSESYGPNAVAAFGSTTGTIEDNILLQHLVHGVYGSANLAYQLTEAPRRLPKATIVSVESARHIVIVGMDLAYDQPMYYLRTVKAQRSGATVVTLSSPSELVTTILTPDTVVLVPDYLSASDYLNIDRVCDATGCGYSVLATDANAYGPYLAGMDGTESPSVAELACGLPASNNTSELLNGLISAQVKHVFVMGSDPVGNVRDKSLAEKAFSSDAFIVVTSQFMNATAAKASVVLPTASFAETGGTYLNVDGQLQSVDAVVPPKAGSRPQWQVLLELNARAGNPLPVFTPSDVLPDTLVPGGSE